MTRPTHSIAILLIACLLFCLSLRADAQNHVLSLDGDGDYVEIGVYPDLVPETFTVEVWLNPLVLAASMPLARGKVGDFSYSFYQFGRTLRMAIQERHADQAFSAAEIRYSIRWPGTWFHASIVFDGTHLTAYFNGIQVGQAEFEGEVTKSDSPLLIGATPMFEQPEAFFRGLVDEVRIWSKARSQQEIRDTMARKLTGEEEGLVGYWNFEGQGAVVVDQTENGHDGVLIGDAHRIVQDLPQPARYAVLSGIVQDETGSPVMGAKVVLSKGRETSSATMDVENYTSSDGNYQLICTPEDISYDLYASQSTKGVVLEDLQLQPGVNYSLDLILTESVHIEGVISMFDGTPQVGVTVQAVRIPPEAGAPGVTMASALSDAEGKYRFANLKPGTYQVRCHTKEGYRYYQHTRDSDPATLPVAAGSHHASIDFRIAPFRKGSWREYTHLHGLADNQVYAMYESLDGSLWAATASGVSQYQATGFVTLTQEDGLAHNIVRDIHERPFGTFWFATEGGVSCYDGESFETFTIADGLVTNSVKDIYEDRNHHLWFACTDRSGYGYGWGWQRGGVTRYDGESFLSLTTTDGLACNEVTCIYQTSDGAMWFGTYGGGVSQYQAGMFTNYGPTDGLAGNLVNTIYEARDNVLWFGTESGVSRYDGQVFRNLTTADGLPHGWVSSITQSSDGAMWLGTYGGISRYDGETFVNYTSPTRLTGTTSLSIHEEAENVFWFGTGDGLYRYDSQSILTVTTQDGLPNDIIRVVHRDSEGNQWIGTGNGLCRFDELGMTAFTTQDGLTSNSVFSIHEDDTGDIWFGMSRGVTRYRDGKFSMTGNQDHVYLSLYRTTDGILWGGTHFGVYRMLEHGAEVTDILEGHGGSGVSPEKYAYVYDIGEDKGGTLLLATDNGIYSYGAGELSKFTTAEGLAGNAVKTLLKDSGSIWWFGTSSGLSRYDGQTFTNYHYRDGLASDRVTASYRASSGKLFLGTASGGVSIYDGEAWSSLDSRDGLPSENVLSLYEDRVAGEMWIGTDKGAARYRPSSQSPVIQIGLVTTNHGTFRTEPFPDIPARSRVTVAYSSIDFHTHPDKHQYRWRIPELDDDWRKPTKSSSADFVPQRPGVYTFEVQAINRDLNYSEPARVALTVVSPFYLRAAFLVPTVGGGSILVIVSIVLAVVAIRRRRQVHAYERYAAQELQDARQMQLSLMPEHAPVIDGAEIAGKCVTANTVGGDFFAYLPGIHYQQIGLVIADVSGKAMRGAMNAVLADGILSMAVQAQDNPTPASIMSEVNTALSFRMESDMNVTMVIGLLDTQAMTLALANAAHHAHPLLVRDGEVQALKSRGLPLGMKAGVQYQEETFGLQSGDILVLMTDGIIEAHDTVGWLYGDSGRLERVMTGFASDMSAEAMVDALIQDAIDYGAGEREDDMTAIVARIREQ